MANFTLTRPDVFPEGTSVKAFKRSNYLQNQRPPTGDVGAADDTRTVTNGATAFAGLADGTGYFATAMVNGVYRVIRFDTPPTGAGTAPAYDRDDGQAGMYCTAMGALPGIATLTLVANRVHVSRFRPSRDMLITKMAFGVQVAATVNDSCDLGIFSGDFQTLLGNLGMTAGLLNGVGVKVVTLSAPIQLRAGSTYYGAFGVGAIGGTAAGVSACSWQSNVIDLFGQGAGTYQATFQNVAPPLAAPFVSAGTTAQVPMLAVREA